MDEPGPRLPPSALGARLRHLGPGLIITGSIVGSGELIMTTKLGSEVGFSLLWLIVLGCLVKVFVQIELGRYAISSGETTLKAMDRVPGPRLGWSWLLWLWLVMYVCIVVQVAGIAGSLAEVLTLAVPDSSAEFWIVITTAAVIILLVAGRYRLVESLSTAMVFLFTVGTVLAVVLLSWTEFPIRLVDIAHGLSFHLSDREGRLIDFTTAFAAFGITGVGASELIYYPYWCLEKGYARHVGPADETPEWEDRARAWISVLQLDAWLSLVVYTVATTAFYLLGAAVLHGQSIEVGDRELVQSLSAMYRASFGPAGHQLFLLGAFFVLFSTYFVATASNARLFADGLDISGLADLSDERRRYRWIKLASALLPAVSLALFLAIGKPVSLVTVGGVAQACMLPLLAGAALWLRLRRLPAALARGSVWTVCLWIAFVAMTAIGAYQLVGKLRPLFGS